ncbi:conserved unknown protein [Ectocarpus siliculosus]|uniref:RNase NYN domain-containing protein n=1 Tax=Ectocarpus siliculosus TaxID=2880 RepID=D7G542_ECTSI|nr:conserved unknown protein [Ectocarpus siliculosus]|eukprot:CBJ33805.1 conserved unknown protein [Ectocarpus siliculosus]
MSEPGGKPTGGSRRAPRRGFEVYSRRAAEAAKTAAAAGGGGGDGHDTTRGRALWEDEREAARLPKGDKEWKRDRGAKGARRGAGAGAGGTAVDADVPSEERYEDMSRRVEEEVVAKLARAQMMGMMLKAHREQEQATERRRGGGGGRRRDGDSGSGGGRRSRGAGAGGAGGGTDSAGPRQVLQRPKDSGRQRPGQAAPSPSARGAVVVGRDVRVGAPSQARSGAGATPRSGGGRGARQQPAGLLKVSAEELLLSEGKSRGAATAAAAAATRALPGDLGGDPDEMGIEDAYAMVSGIERQHKTLLESLRREIGLVAAGRPGAAQATSGSAAVGEAAAAAAAAAMASSSRAAGGELLPGAALYGKVSRVRVALSRALGSLIRRDPGFSLRKRLPNRLWMAHYRELEVIQQRLRQLLTGAGGASDTAGASQQQRQKQPQALRSRLFALVDEAERDIGGMVEAVERQQAAAAADSARNKGSAAASPSSSPSSSSSNGGHKANADKTDAGAASGDTGGGGGSADGGMAGSMADSDDEDDEDMTLEERGRQQALQAFLTSLGDLSRYRGLHGRGDSEGSGGKGSKASYARAHELYLRALKVDPSSGKVWNQMAVLASSRQDNLEAFYAYLRGLCAAVPHTAGRESLLVLHEKCKARLSTLREATALDAIGFEEHEARFRLYLLGACGTCLSRVDLGTFDGYLVLSDRHMVSCVQLHLMKAAAEAGGGGGGRGDGTQDPGGEQGLGGTLARSIVMCVCTVSASMESSGMKGGSWTEDGATSRAVRLCLSLAGSLAGLHRKTSQRGWEKVTAAGVGVFLDWLTCKPQFGEGARGTRPEEFQRVMACVVEFANGIIRASSASGGGSGKGVSDDAFSSAPRRRRRPGGAGDGADDGEQPEIDPDSTLWEDEVCRGLPALETVSRRRTAKARKRARDPPRGSDETRTDNGGHDGGSSGSDSGGAGAAGRPGSKLWADTSSDRVEKDRSGKEREGGSRPSSSSSSSSAADVWKIRVARLRKQVEFCVERGWIARGNRPGTYTLPKPPPRFGGSSGPPRDDENLPSEEHHHHSQDGDGGGMPPPPPIAVEDFPEGGFAGEGYGGGGVVGFPTDRLPPPLADAARGRGAPGGGTSGGGTLWVEADAGSSGTAARGGGGGGGSGAPRTRARQPPRVPVVPPGHQRNYVLTGAGGGDRGGGGDGGPGLLTGGGGGGGGGDGGRGDHPLPDSVLEVVLAGLGSPNDDGEELLLCAYCCATLSPAATECGVCGAPTPAAAAVAAAAAETMPTCKWKAYRLAEDGRPYYSDGESSVWVKPKELEDYEAALAANGAAAAAAAAAVGGGGSGGALPAGVLAVGDLAEVMARSKPSLPGTTAASGAGRGGGGRSGRGAGRDAHNPAKIARAGLGDGGAGGSGRSPSAGAAAGGGGAMFGWPRGAPRSALPLVVIDVPNVAMRHGLNKKFSCTGVQMAVEYFRTAGHRVLGFLPDYYLDLKRTNGLERAKKLGVADVKASRLPDDVQLLQRLVDDGLIVSTPPQDYDDSYCIKYAMARDGYVVTNDLYRDHVKGIEGRKKADAARRWIKAHSISYTFVGDEFFPNPDFSFHQDGNGGGGGGKG